MAEQIDGTAAPEDIAAKVTQAATELEDIMQANQSLHQKFESHEWSGLDSLSQARTDLDHTRDGLGEVARKLGLAEQVAETLRQNQMVGDKESLGKK